MAQVDFTQDLEAAGSGLQGVSQTLKRISTDSDADASPQKNATDINELAMAMEFIVKALEEMARQHAIIKLKIAKLAGEDMGAAMPGGEQAPPVPPAL